MNKQTVIFSVLITALLVVVSFLCYQQKHVMKIGLVNMDEYVYSYNGMKQASENYAAKVTKWNQQADSTKKVLENLYQQIKLDSIEHNKQKQQANMMRFQLIGKSYLEFKENIANKAKEEDNNMTQGVLTQLDGYIKEYAEQNGYDLILTNSREKSVGYIKVDADLTKELVEYANSKFENK